MLNHTKYEIMQMKIGDIDEIISFMKNILARSVPPLFNFPRVYTGLLTY